MIRKFINCFILFIICVVPLIITPWAKDYYYHPKILTIIILCSFLAVLCILNLKKLQVENSILDLLIICYISLVCLSTIFSVNIHQSFMGRVLREEGLFAICCYLFIFQVSSKFYNYSDRHINIFLLSSIIISIYGISQYFGFDPIPIDPIRKQWHHYAYSTLGNPNFFGSYLTLILPISIFSYIYTNKNVYLSTSSILFLSLLCTRTRGTWLGFMSSFIILCYFLYRLKANSKPVLKIITIFLAITILLNIFNHNETIKRFTSIIKDAKSVATLSQKSEYAGSTRIFIWKRAIKLIPKKPFLGYGPDTFDIEFMNTFRNDTKKFIGEIIVDKAHNEYLQIAVTTGVPSLVVYLGILYLILKKSYKNIQKNILIIPLLCSISGYLVQAFFNISVVSVAPVYWTTLGILSNFSNLEKN